MAPIKPTTLPPAPAQRTQTPAPARPAGTFPAPPDLAHWNRNEFIDFHKRAWAVLQQRSSRCQIAEGP